LGVYEFAGGAAARDDSGGARAYRFQRQYKVTHLSCELPSHIDHGIIGLMDPAHGPFVHQSWFWRKRGSIHEKAKQFQPIPNGFRMSPHSPSTNSAPYQLLRGLPASGNDDD